MHEEALSTARSLLLDPYGLDDGKLDQIFADMYHHDLDYADLYFQYTRQEAWRLEEGIVKTGQFAIDQGVGVRAIAGEKTAFAYSDDIGMDALKRVALGVRSIGQVGGHYIQSPYQQRLPKGLYVVNDLNGGLDAAAKVALLEHIERMARQMDPRIIQVMAGVAMEYDVVYIARADGVRAADIRPLVRVSVTVIAEQQGRREQGSSGGGGRFGLAYFTQERLKHYVDQAVQQALTNLDARPAPAGAMTVVLGSGWPGVLLHEAIGHGLEGDFNRKGVSAFSGKLGQTVAAAGVNVVDDGVMHGRRGSLAIDDEGNPTQQTTLIENGRLQSYMQDAMNARLMGHPLTGNGRRESYAHVPMPRMTNTYMLPGKHAPEEIIASVDNGIYAVNFGGGQVDITSGKFVFSTSEAWRIENGKVTYPVKGATLIGNGPDVLRYVSMVGNDLALDQGVGVCGKEGQSVPVGVGQPTLRIDGGLTVGGTGG